MTNETELPAWGYMRLPAILKVYPIGRSTWWAGVKSGRFPKPVKLGLKTTVWRVEDIKALIANPEAPNPRSFVERVRIKPTSGEQPQGRLPYEGVSR